MRNMTDDRFYGIPKGVKGPTEPKGVERLLEDFCAKKMHVASGILVMNLSIALGGREEKK